MQLENELRRPAYNESVDVDGKFTKWRFKSVVSDSVVGVQTRKPNYELRSVLRYETQV